MAMTSRRNGIGRIYQRKFDHEEAAARHATGVSIRELAEEYGVTPTAVYDVVTPGEKERNVAYAREWRMRGRCEGCGKPAMKNGGRGHRHSDGRTLCARCRADERRERLLFNADGHLIAVRCSHLDCANGERWQPPENFPAGERHREVRPNGIHSDCRSCGTRARQAYRERRKVPCVGCGTPCLPPSEKKTHGYDQPRCRDCFYKSRRGAA